MAVRSIRDADLSEKQRKERNKKAYRIYSEISEKLFISMKLRGYSQEKLREVCTESGYPISQSSISKILSYPNPKSPGSKGKYDGDESPYSISLASFFYLCKALRLSPSEILNLDSDFTINNSENPDNGEGDKRAQLLIKPTEDEFNGYLGEYDCYFFSTISSEAHLLHGVLTLEESTLRDYCQATFELGTNKFDDNGDEIKKIYTGKIAISPRMGSCYCLLENEQIGELCFIVFRYLYLNNEKLKCRVGVVATASAGDNRRPTMHRMLICRGGISDEKLEILKAQLLLNTSDILISKKNLERLRSQEGMPFPKEVAELFDTAIHAEEYYRLSEFQIKSLDLDLEDRLRAICLLRNMSTAPKYNKVGSKTDELVFDYLTPDCKESADPLPSVDNDEV